MKNFKKVLALVLVLASLLGLATMAGAATEYKDADKINADYTEAIKVLDLNAGLSRWELQAHCNHHS